MMNLLYQLINGINGVILLGVIAVVIAEVVYSPCLKFLSLIGQSPWMIPLFLGFLYLNYRGIKCFLKHKKKGLSDVG